MATPVFSSSIVGPPPGTTTVGTDLWIDLGLIPSGKDIWIGKAQYNSPYKSVTFELRSNLATKNTGTLTTTKLLYSYAVAPKNGSLLLDLYKKGTLHIATVKSTGVEHWWLHITSKTSVAQSYLYGLYYTLE